MGWKDIQALSTFLGQKNFMFGETPTELDAVVFGKAKPEILPMHEFYSFFLDRYVVYVDLLPFNRQTNY